MLTFTASHTLYNRVGLILLALPFFLFVLALPPLQAGIWIQAEPVMLGLFICACLSAGWLAFGIAYGRLIVQRAHPLLICMLLWLGWQLLATLFAVSSYRSWFGPPEMGSDAVLANALILQKIMAKK